MEERQRRPSVLVRQRRIKPKTPRTETEDTTGAVSRFRRRLSRLESMVLPQTNKIAESPLLQKSYSEVKSAGATTESFFATTRTNEPNATQPPGLLKKNSTGALKRRFRSASTTLAAFTSIIRRNNEYSAAANT
ncbi:hypothetical protein FB639_006294, partial [Coemansia asiatica]